MAGLALRALAFRSAPKGKPIGKPAARANSAAISMADVRGSLGPRPDRQGHNHLAREKVVRGMGCSGG